MPHVELPQAEFKVVVLGDSHTGKTSLMLRFVEGSYREEREPTIGAFFLTKRVTVDSITCKLLIWDTSGQHNFAKLAKTYYKDAAAVILNFDVTQPTSLQRVKYWLEEFQNRNFVTTVCACKCDLPPSPGLVDEAQRVAQLYGADYHRTSAKDDWGVQELFANVTKNVLRAQSLTGAELPVTMGGRVESPQKSLPLSTTNHPSPTKEQASPEKAPLESSLDDGVQENEDLEKSVRSTKENVMCEGAFMVCGAEQKDCCIM